MLDMVNLSIQGIPPKDVKSGCFDSYDGALTRVTFINNNRLAYSNPITGHNTHHESFTSTLITDNGEETTSQYGRIPTRRQTGAYASEVNGEIQHGSVTRERTCRNAATTR
jgi:hypothetical protein